MEGIAALLGSENGSRYTGVSQLQSHQSRYSVQLRPCLADFSIVRFLILSVVPGVSIDGVANRVRDDLQYRLASFLLTGKSSLFRNCEFWRSMVICPPPKKKKIYIYIYVVELKTGPRFGVSSVKNWSKSSVKNWSKFFVHCFPYFYSVFGVFLKTQIVSHCAKIVFFFLQNFGDVKNEVFEKKIAFFVFSFLCWRNRNRKKKKKKKRENGKGQKTL